MPPDTGKPRNAAIAPPVATPRYETRDANVRGVFNFLVVLTAVLIATALVCFGMFRYFSAHQRESADLSPFGETRQLPLGPQLQVNPREDLLHFREQQEQSLETYAWENRSAGIVRVSIELGMQLLLQKGLPVQGVAASPAAATDAAKAVPKAAAKPMPAGSKKSMNAKAITVLCITTIVMGVAPSMAQQSATPAILNQVSIAQNLNTLISPDIVFRDENGKSVRLGDFFGQKPIVLSLVYFDCPALCTEVLNGELRTMRSMSLYLGKDFEAITVSFEPRDTPALAKAKRDVYAGQYGRTGAVDNWHFLTGEQQPIDALTQAVGFHYAYNSRSRQYAHAAAIMVLTPDGRIDRYFYGVQYPARDVRLGLVEASQGKIGTVTDHALLFCYQYDPTTGKYGLIVMNVVRAGGVLTLLALGSFMFVMFRRDRKLHVAPPAVTGRIR